jgi:hypothetical protein
MANGGEGLCSCSILVFLLETLASMEGYHLLNYRFHCHCGGTISGKMGSRSEVKRSLSNWIVFQTLIIHI